MLASSPHWTLTLSPRIAGGRYESRFRVGEVTCLDAADLPLLHLSLKSPSMTLERSGLFPTFDLMYMYSRSHPNRGFYQILVAFRILQVFDKQLAQ
ncbi:putative RNA helicase [Rosa chinensis]|uniref:Putative RNA helicase n=1 Tax=Rosa chinensis TaxID=74649 RepID=A0A2P6RFF5_ROSCH|nr:putative RNA helicase [Rosa chinensis]